ncbi:hypothetical protein [Tsukamurella sp. NPDC003166]|uniref:hypothetical protein n=1 Tax=Tsukamurella sp. NPDC003166 TaxID=3154444 RepID=UPI0033B0DE14
MTDVNRSFKTVTIAGAAGLALALTVSGTAGTVLAPAASAAPGCAASTAPLVTVPSRAATEPIVQLPKPAGWERFDTAGRDVRLALVNRSLIADEFAPVAVVTVDKSDSANAKAAVDREVGAIRSSFGTKSVRTGTVCGFPSATVDYDFTSSAEPKPHPATLVAVGVPSSGGVRTVTLTLMTSRGDAPAYRAGRSTMVSGLQIQAR